MYLKQKMILSHNFSMEKDNYVIYLSLEKGDYASSLSKQKEINVILLSNEYCSPGIILDKYFMRKVVFH